MIYAKAYGCNGGWDSCALDSSIYEYMENTDKWDYIPKEGVKPPEKISETIRITPHGLVNDKPILARSFKEAQILCDRLYTDSMTSLDYLIVYETEEEALADSQYFISRWKEYTGEEYNPNYTRENKFLNLETIKESIAKILKSAIKQMEEDIVYNSAQ